MSPEMSPGSGPYVVGLTGGIGVGKSTVAGLLAELGSTIIDCDLLGRRVVEPDGSAFAAVVERFGTGVVGADGQLDRPALASIVFADGSALDDLNAITHPAIDREIEAGIAAAETEPVVLDMAVLVESSLGEGQYHQVLVVEAPLDVRIRRLVEDRGMEESAATARINSQASDGERRAVADHVLTNDGSLGELRSAVATYHAGLLERLGR